MPPKHLPYIEISLDNLVHNLNQIRQKINPSNSLIAVVKDDAYGCGATIIAQTLEKEGVGFFAVTCMDEAKELRVNSVLSPILVFGECSEDEIEWASSNKVRITLNDLASLKKVAKQNHSLQLHINVDTGMNRLGVSIPEVVASAEIIASNSNLELEGIFTHFACADVPETDTVSIQNERFEEALNIIEKNGLSPKYIHAPNSAALIRFPVPHNILVRPGITLYGCKPDPAQDFDINLLPIASLKAGIIKIKKVPSGTPISYGETYITNKETLIATIPIGYAHGLPHALSNKGEVLIRGRRFPIVGAVTMDWIMVDIGSETDITVGDEVVAIGSQGNETISPDDIALLCNSVIYEILCGLNNRIDRFYYRNNKIINHQQNISHGRVA